MIRRSIKFLLIMVLSSYGCAAPPLPKYYRLPLDTSTQYEISLRSYRESLRVVRFRAITPLRQDSMVTYRAESALVDFSAHDLWESTPPDIITRELVEAFRASRIFSRIDDRPRSQRTDYLIRGRILRFNRLEANDGPYGDVWLEVEFVHQKNREVLWSAVIKDQKKADGDTTEAVVQALSAALGQCILQIVQQVKLATASRHPFQ